MMEIFLTILVLVAAMALTFVWRGLRRRRLNSLQRERLQKMQQVVDKIQDPAMRVLQADAVLHKALEAAGYSGTTAEKLRQAGARFSNEDAVWRAHKLRNQVAHEPQMQIDNAEAARAVKAFWKAIEQLH